MSARKRQLGGPGQGGAASQENGESRVTQPALLAYLRAIRSHPFVIVVAVVASLIGSAPFVIKAPSYEATVQILVTPIPPTDRSFIGLPLPRGLGDPVRSATTGAQIVDSPQAAAAVAAVGGGAETADSISSAVDVAVRGNSNIIELTAEAESPEAALELADDYGAAALEQRRLQLRPLVAEQLATAERELARIPDSTGEAAALVQSRIADLRSILGAADPTLSIVQSAELPQAPSGLPRSIRLAIALACGLLIGIVASLLVELLVTRRLRDQADLIDAYPLPVLARVPWIRRGLGRRPAVTANPPLAIGEPFRALRTQLEMRAARLTNGKRPGAVVLVTGAPRGVGRTTTAAMLARTLARANYQVVLIDADLGSPGLVGALGASPRADLRAVATGARIADIVTPVLPRVELVAAPGVPDADLAEQISTRAAAVVEEARGLADWVVIDGPPLHEAGELLPLAAAADLVVVVSGVGKTHQVDMTATRELFEAVNIVATGHVLIGGVPKRRSADAVPRLNPGGVRRSPPRAPAHGS